MLMVMIMTVGILIVSDSDGASGNDGNDNHDDNELPDPTTNSIAILPFFASHSPSY